MKQRKVCIVISAHIYFTSTQAYKECIIGMGEDVSRVFCSGAPGIDNIVNSELLLIK